MADERRKVWAFLMWEESAPSGWVQAVEKLHVAAAVSPLHDRDKWDENDFELGKCGVENIGKPKKPHWHVVLYFESLKSPAQVRSMVEHLGVSYVEAVESPRAYNRYLCHLDQPNKAAYSADDVIRLNGAQCDMSKPNPTADEQAKIRDAILDLIDGAGIVEYWDLVMYAHRNGMDDWSWYIEHHTQYLNAVLKSKRHGCGA